MDAIDAVADARIVANDATMDVRADVTAAPAAVMCAETLARKFAHVIVCAAAAVDARTDAAIALTRDVTVPAAAATDARMDAMLAAACALMDAIDAATAARARDHPATVVMDAAVCDAASPVIADRIAIARAAIAP